MSASNRALSAGAPQSPQSRDLGTTGRPLCLLTERSAYGQTRTYPKNLTARLLLGLTGRRTFRRSDFEAIEALGFEIRFVEDRREK